jgi:hydrogenase-4 component E
MLDAMAVALLGITLFAVSTHRLDHAIYLLAAQGAVLTGAAAVVALASGGSHGVAAVALTLGVKALAIPGMLLFALRQIRVRRELEVTLPSLVALPLAVGLVLVAYQVVGPLGAIDEYGTHNALPVSVAMLLIGLFTMLIRKKALSQVGGLVTMENGIYLAALTATRGLPLAVELGIALDLLVGVAVMGFVSRQIHRAFDSTNTDHLRTLRG